MESPGTRQWIPINKGITVLKLMIASRNEVDNTLIEKKLSPIAKKIGPIEFQSARPANLKNLLDHTYNLLVYNGQDFNSALRNNILHWRNVGYLGPIMLLAKITDASLMDRFTDLHNVTIIEKPYDNKDLQGIAIKYLKDVKVAQRRHRRFETQQSALLESYTRDFNAHSVIANISKGGAQIVGQLDQLTKGDLLRVSIELDQLQKNRTMSAEVVWTEGDVGSHERLAGLRFISKAQVYDTLLNGV